MSVVLSYDDHDAYRAAFAAWPCRYCNGVGAIAITPVESEHGADHYAGVWCKNCNRHLRWLGWPPRSKADEKQRRRYKRLTRLDDDRCHLCLRSRLQLPDGVRLEDRHIIDRAILVDAGRAPDLPENLGWICSAPCKGIEIALRAAFDHDRIWAETE